MGRSSRNISMDKNKDEIDVSEYISFENVNSTLVLKNIYKYFAMCPRFLFISFLSKTARLSCQDMMR